MNNPVHQIGIKPLKTVLPLLAVSMIIILCGLIGQGKPQVGNPVETFFLDLFAKEFYVNGGTNIVTYWNMFTLTVMSVLALVITSVKVVQKEKYRREWSALCVVFFYFATDALSGITQKLSALLRELPDMQVGTYYNWFYAVAAVLILILLVFFIRFYFHLDAGNRILFPISIILYVLGAFREELFSGYYAALYGSKTTAYMLMTHAEEFVELAGILLMIYLLLTYITAHYPEIEFIPQAGEKEA